MLKKKILLAMIPLLGIATLGTICSSFNEPAFEPALAEEDSDDFEEDDELLLEEDEEDTSIVNEDGATTYATLVINKVKRSDNKVVSKLVDTYIISQKDADEVIKNARKTVKKSGAIDNTYTTESILTLKRDCDIDFSDLDFGKVVLNLKGFNFSLNYRTSWDFHESLEIDGGKGTITTYNSKRQSGAFELLEGATKLDVYDTTFKNFDCRRYPIFQIKGNEKKGFRPKGSIDSCNFENCKSSRYGGVIYIKCSGNFDFDNCNFNNCSSTYGGVAYFEKTARGVIQFRGCKAKNCTAKYGGFIYCEGLSEPKGDYIYTSAYGFQHCQIDYCYAKKYGGCVYNDSFATFQSQYTTISNCSAGERGGAFYFDYRSFYRLGTISNCTAKYGGGIYINAEGCELRWLDFNKCRAYKQGNAIYSKYKYEAEACKFNDCNEASDIGETAAIFVESTTTESVQAPSNVSLWVMGSLILAAIVGSTVTVCLVFRKKKKAE